MNWPKWVRKVEVNRDLDYPILIRLMPDWSFARGKHYEYRKFRSFRAARWAVSLRFMYRCNCAVCDTAIVGGWEG